MELSLQKNKLIQGTKNETEQIKKIKAAYKNLKDTQRKSGKIRNEFLEELAKKRAEEWKMEDSSAIKIIQQAEASKKLFAKQGLHMGKVKNAAFKQIHIPTPRADIEPGWEKVEDEDCIFNLILKQNAKQLIKSKDSPFARGLLAKECGYDGEGQLANDILNGKVQETTKQLLRAENKQYAEEIEDIIEALTRTRRDDGDTVQDFKWKFGKEEFQKTFN